MSFLCSFEQNQKLMLCVRFYLLEQAQRIQMLAPVDGLPGHLLQVRLRSMCASGHLRERVLVV
jgi:hypothetical protein